MSQRAGEVNAVTLSCFWWALTGTTRPMVASPAFINLEKSEKKSKGKGTYEKHSQLSYHHRTYRVVTLIESNFWQRETDGEKEGAR